MKMLDSKSQNVVLSATQLVSLVSDVQDDERDSIDGDVSRIISGMYR